MFECLVERDSLVLQQANAIVSGTGRYGSWEFEAVVDGTLVMGEPSQVMLNKRVNGERMLIGVGRRLTVATVFHQSASEWLTWTTEQRR